MRDDIFGKTCEITPEMDTEMEQYNKIAKKFDIGRVYWDQSMIMLENLGTFNSEKRDIRLNPYVRDKTLRLQTFIHELTHAIDPACAPIRYPYPGMELNRIKAEIRAEIVSKYFMEDDFRDFGHLDMLVFQLQMNDEHYPNELDGLAEEFFSKILERVPKWI